MLSVDNINLFYGAAQALRSVSLKAQIGRVTTVLGRNGVGKSSLLRAIVGQQQIASGAVMWQGQDISRFAPYERARLGIGYVPQGREIFPLLTVRENLMTGFATQGRATRFIDDEIFSLFPVLSEMMGRRGGDLSGGQQQQLAIGRALMSEPQLLILDEPTEGIQPSIIQDIGRTLRQLVDEMGMTVLLVEQYYDFAKAIADRYWVMSRGEIIAGGDGANMDADGVRGLIAV